MKFWRHYLPDIRKTFKGLLVTQFRNDKELAFAEGNGIRAVPGADYPGLGRDRLYFNMNSGAQAINLAYLGGASEIVLVGYDMKGFAHWHDDHPQPMTNGNYGTYVHNFTRLAKDLEAEGVTVLNATRDTALTQFKRVSLDDIL